jgi:glycosyl transferase family 25
MKIDHVFYINLEYRTDRKSEIESELESYGILNYERFPAIKHDTIGGVGCGKSHIEVLKLAKKRGYNNVLIFEDDFQFVVSKEHFKERMQLIENDIVPFFDVFLLSHNIFQETNVSGQSELRRVIESQTASGYIVNAHYYDTLIEVFEDAMPKLEATNYHWIYCIDIVWKPLIVSGLWFRFEPTIGVQRLGSMSDCSNVPNTQYW